jgi:outer membrane protein assembly factor BamB
MRHRVLIAASAVIALALCLSGCASGLPSIKNPFSKEEEKLPGQRVAVITSQGVGNVDPSLAAKPMALPPPRNNPSWTQPGGIASNNLGHLALGESVHQIWTADAGKGSSSRGRLSALPLVADGKVFTLDAGGDVSAFAASSGQRLWTASVTPENEKSAEGFGGGIALDGGQLYATTGYGTVVAINPGNGQIVWTKRTGEPIRSSPTAAGGKIYFVSTDSTLHCLNAADGAELWTARGLPQPATLLSNVSPAVGKGFVIAPFAAGDIVAYQMDGQRAWNESLSREGDTSGSGVLGDPARPVIDQGVVFAVSHGGKMIASSEATGERLWTRSLASTQMPWVAGDTVYVVDIAGKLLALSRAEGKIRWMVDLPPSGRWSGPVLAGGKVWAVSANGLLVGADARTGTLGSQVDLGTEVYVAPVVADGRMYILSDNARLIALN